jgi:hypothetical protein
MALNLGDPGYSYPDPGIVFWDLLLMMMIKMMVMMIMFTLKYYNKGVG